MILLAWILGGIAGWFYGATFELRKANKRTAKHLTDLEKLHSIAMAQEMQLIDLREKYEGSVIVQ